MDGWMDERMKEGSNFGKELFVERGRASDRCFYSSSSSPFLLFVFCLYREKDLWASLAPQKAFEHLPLPFSLGQGDKSAEKA